MLDQAAIDEFQKLAKYIGARPNSIGLYEGINKLTGAPVLVLAAVIQNGDVRQIAPVAEIAKIGNLDGRHYQFADAIDPPAKPNINKLKIPRRGRVLVMK